MPSFHPRSRDAVRVTALLGALATAACSDPPTYVGSATCARCHEPETHAWRASDHARAMRSATDSAVRGDFADRTLIFYGDTIRFHAADGGRTVTIAGPDGRPRAYPITHTFGADPLQQYLVAFPRGRLQVLPVAWDTRPAPAGGGRWFHMYPDEPIRAGDELFWTGILQNWNYMCAECHSTDLRKNYIAAADSFATTWSEIDVACEACHGPGSRHVARERTILGVRPPSPRGRGLAVRFDERAGAAWAWDSEAVRPVRGAPPRGFRPEVETCARCHARRAQVWGAHAAGRPLLDTHRPALLEPRLYFADGQIEDEVYEYGSFLQSRMYRAGVTCGDCHDPHSATLRAPGNAVCAGCHPPARYDVPAHHRHKGGEPGSACVDCHMATRTYMVIDARRDHSMRVPRPDVAARVGAPDACTACHGDKGARWADDAIAGWYAPRRATGPHFGDAFDLARRGDPRAEEALIGVAADTGAGPWVQASALAALGGVLSQRGLDAVARRLDDPDPLVRFGAAQALAGAPAGVRASLAAPLLRDPVRVVRLEATALVAEAARDRLSEAELRVFERSAEEYRASQRFNADQPWAHLNLGALAADLGDLAGAEEAFRTSIRVDSGFVQGYVNLADLYRAQGRDAEGEPLLRRAVAIAPAAAPAHYALGLLLVRRGRLADAVVELRRAAELEPDDPRFIEALRLAGQAR